MLKQFFSKKTQPVAEENDSSSIGDWLEENNKDGQLPIDVYQTKNEIIIKAAIAGVKPEDLKISLHNDLLTIKAAQQEEQEISEREYLYQECFWNSFSRSLILPHEVDNERIEAVLEDGVLTITLHKINRHNIEVTVN